MKISQTVVALLATAILCIGLVSCERKITKKNETISEKPQNEPVNMIEITGNTTDLTEKETDISSLTGSIPGTDAPTRPNATVAPTKVVTTVPSSTAHTSTTAPSTTAATTTAVATTTAPVTTTAPATTEPIATEPPTVEQTTNIITDSEDMDSEQTVIAIVNRYRIAEGLGELSYSPELSAAADIRAKELASNYSHLRPDGTFWYTILPGVGGENIAKGFAAADGVIEFWIKSEGHSKLILTSKFTVTGVGCYYDNTTDTYYWVQLFA